MTLNEYGWKLFLWHTCSQYREKFDQTSWTRAWIVFIQYLKFRDISWTNPSGTIKKLSKDELVTMWPQKLLDYFASKLGIWRNETYGMLWKWNLSWFRCFPFFFCSHVTWSIHNSVSWVHSSRFVTPMIRCLLLLSILSTFLRSSSTKSLPVWIPIDRSLLRSPVVSRIPYRLDRLTFLCSLRSSTIPVSLFIY